MTHEDAIGFVPGEEIANVWTEAMRRLEEILPECNPERSLVLELFETTKYELFRRAKRHFAELQKRYPAAVKSDVEARARAELEQQRNRHEHQRRSQMGRAYANNPTFEGGKP